VRTVTGLALGAAAALVEMGYFLVAGGFVALASPSPRGRRAAARWVGRAARRLAALEVRRLEFFLAGPDLDHADRYGDGQALRYLALRWPVGLLGGAVLGLLVWGAGTGVTVAGLWAIGELPDGIAPTWPVLMSFVLLGAVLLFIDLQGIVGVAALDRRLARRLLGPSAQDLLRRRITELTASRAGIVAAVDAERRRIERDLHDGAQQRVVALAMLLGRARRSRDPGHAADLLRQAHEESQHLLYELRDVAWRVYPTALENLGLGEALARVADRSGVPVRLRYDLPERVATPVETIAYFVVCEAVTNAAKHAGATSITVEVSRRAGPGEAGDGEPGDAGQYAGPPAGPPAPVVVRIEDDGVGGADPTGDGLSGLARRVAALDGRFRVQSPPGGPTVVVAELPCG
jgi:signal transduction histidine kinase